MAFAIFTHLAGGGCVFRDKDGAIYRFNPLSPVSDEFMDWYVETRGIKLCKLYYPPFNFTRTGCKGCPYAVNVGKDLAIMKELMPAEYKQCNIIWAPVYGEYKRLRYRKMHLLDLDQKKSDDESDKNFDV